MPQRQRTVFPVVDFAAVRLVKRIIILSDRLFQLCRGRGRPLMILCTVQQAVIAAGVGFDRLFKRLFVTGGRFRSYFVNPRTAYRGRRSRKVFGNQFVPQTDGLKRLRPPKTANGGDSGAAETFQQPLFHRGHIRRRRFFGGFGFFQFTVFRHRLNDVQSQNGTDRIGTERNQLSHMNDFTRFARFGNDARFVTHPLTDQSVMQSRNGQQGRNRGVLRIIIQIAQNQYVRAAFDGFTSFVRQTFQRGFHTFSAFFDGIKGFQTL